MYLSAPFILQNFKKIFRVDPELWGCAIFKPKIAQLSWTIFFWQKPLLLLSSTYWPFSLWKVLKNSYSGSRVMRIHDFWDQNSPFAPNIFFLRIINIILIYLLAPFIMQNFKKILPVDPEIWGCAIFWPKMAHFLRWKFSQKAF